MSTIGDPPQRPHFASSSPYPSFPIPPGVVDAPDPRDLHRAADAYVGDDDHAELDVDRGGFAGAHGFRWADEDRIVEIPGPLTEEEAEDIRKRFIEMYDGTPQRPVIIHQNIARMGAGLGLNPKDAAQFRDKKPPLDLLEREANEAISWAMQHGAIKYGRQNYLTIDIRARIYAAAVMRHAQQFLDGEDEDMDSCLSHWAHIGANVHVFLAALAAGKVVDDRGPAPRTPAQEERSEVSNHGRTV